VMAPVDCTPAPSALCAPPEQTPTDPGTVPEFDPKSAALQASTGQRLTGKFLAADALRKAGFPESAIPLGVAIAKYESGFNPAAANSSNHVGLWQISGPNAANLNLGDRTDPYVNARYAKALWDGRGGTWAKDWSVYNTAKQHESEFANLGQASPNAPADPGGPAARINPSAPTTPPVDCSSVDATIATWNVLYTNSSSNAVAGVKAIAASGAVIINGQEWSKTGVRAAATRALGPDWQETNHDTNSTPIWVNTTVFDILSEAHPEAFGIVHVENGASGTVLGPRQISEVTVRRKSNGQVFSMINTHLMPDSDGKPKRTAVFRDHIRKVVNEVGKLSAQGPVILAGDWNQKVGDPLLQPLIDAGCTSTAATLGVEATIGKSTSYDQIYYCGTGAPSSQTLYANHGSDHRGYGATFPGAQVGSADAVTPSGSIRTVKDPKSGKVYNVPIPAGKAGIAVNFALDQVGDRYVWAAHGPDAWDCSGLVSGAWGAAGVKVYPQTEALLKQLPRATGPVQAGDLLYHPGHVAMALYTLNGKDIIVEAANPRAGVRITEQWRKPTAVLRPDGGQPA
jgi:endonuclease/exonuclease/phosphatase (EEP) superfamily protein YafD